MKKCVCVCVWSFCLLFPDISIAQIRSNLLSSVSKRNSSNSDFEMKKDLDYILSSTFIVSVMLFAGLNFDLLLGKDVIYGKFKLVFI